MIANTDPISRQTCLMVAPYYYPEMIGSAPYCTDLAEWLAANGWEVRVLTTRPRYPSPDAFPEYQDGARDVEVVRGVLVRHIPVKPRSGAGAVSRLRGDLSFLAGAIAGRVTGKLSPANVVLAFVPSILSVAIGLAFRVRKGRLVAVVHDIESGLARALGLLRPIAAVSLLERLERFLLNRSDAVIVLTSQMAQALRANKVAAPITVLPIWADLRDLPGETTAPLGGPVTLMYSGALGRKQGLHQIVELAARLLSTHPQVCVVIQGSGSERGELEAEVRSRRLSNIEFRDLVPKDRLLESLREADIQLVPQDARVGNYAIPSKLVSIMSAARPFVSTAEPGGALEELARASGAGFCVPTGDVDALYRAVVTLVENAELRQRLGMNGQRHVREVLAAPLVLKRYEEMMRAPTALPIVGDEVQTPA